MSLSPAAPGPKEEEEEEEEEGARDAGRCSDNSGVRACLGIALELDNTCSSACRGATLLPRGRLVTKLHSPLVSHLKKQTPLTVCSSSQQLSLSISLSLSYTTLCSKYPRSTLCSMPHPLCASPVSQMHTATTYHTVSSIPCGSGVATTRGLWWGVTTLHDEFPCVPRRGEG